MVLNIGLAQSHNYDNNHKITYHYYMYYDYSVSNLKRLKKWTIYAIINLFIISVSF